MEAVTAMSPANGGFSPLGVFKGVVLLLFISSQVADSDREVGRGKMRDLAAQRFHCGFNSEKRSEAMSSKPEEVLAISKEYVDFLNACKSPWHVVDRVRTEMTNAGFKELSMDEPWDLKPGMKYFVTKGGSTIIAFGLPNNWTPRSAIAFVAPHSDSPALRIKPRSSRGREGFIQVGAALYGGGFWHTWFDRDLGIAGRVFVRKGDIIEGRLLRIDKPLANIPSLAIHFDGSMNDNLKINFETQLLPMIGLGDPSLGSGEKHQPLLLDILSSALGVNKDDIVEFELNLYDTNPACIGGENQDFVFGQNQDNQYCSFVAMRAFLDAVNSSQFNSSSHVYLYGTYDHEEVGNESDVGASSDWTRQVLKNITGRENFLSVMNRSYALSADVDHGVNPNYTEYYEQGSRPALDGGPVIKYNNRLEMATNGRSAAFAREIGRIADIPIQSTVPINNKRTGSTHGPALSALLGINTCDFGPPLLAMHSIREVSSTTGVWQLKKFIQTSYEQYGAVAEKFMVKNLADKLDNGVHVSEKQSYKWTKPTKNRNA